MSETRRGFIQSAVLTGSTLGVAAAQAPPAAPEQPPAAAAAPGGRGGSEPVVDPMTPASELQVPKVKFGNVEISRLILGYNPMKATSHQTSLMSNLMREYYTHEQVVLDLHKCTRYGINCCSFTPSGRAILDQETFQLEGGQMHIIFQGDGRPDSPSYDALKPAGIYSHGNTTDRAFRNGTMDEIKEWCKRTRDKGVVVGIGTHNPAVIEYVEEDGGFDFDWYQACVYYTGKTDEEESAFFATEERPVDGAWWAGDPQRMYDVLKHTDKQITAFKILAAGRERDIEGAFRLAFENLKPNDCVVVGMFTKISDQIRENAAIACKVLRELQAT